MQDNRYILSSFADGQLYVCVNQKVSISLNQFLNFSTESLNCKHAPAYWMLIDCVAYTNSLITHGCRLINQVRHPSLSGRIVFERLVPRLVFVYCKHIHAGCRHETCRQTRGGKLSPATDCVLSLCSLTTR